MMPQEKFSPFNVKDELQEKTVEEIKDWQKGVTIPYSVAMYNTIKDFNLASVIRNACAFGFEKIFIIGHRKWDRRGAVGAHNYLTIEFLPDFNALMNIFERDHIIALELPEHYPALAHTFAPIQFFEWAYGDCLLLGEEGQGIPLEHLEQVTNRVYIEQPGAMRSLNAATAAGIAMHNISVHAPVESNTLF